MENTGQISFFGSSDRSVFQLQSAPALFGKRRATCAAVSRSCSNSYTDVVQTVIVNRTKTVSVVILDRMCYLCLVARLHPHRAMVLR